MKWLESYSYHYADRCVTVTSAFTSHAQSMGVKRKDISTIPTGARRALSHIPPKYIIDWHRIHNHEKKFIVFYAGSFNEHYGVLSAIEAACIANRKNPNILWCFAGNGRHLDQMKKASADFDFIHYLGALAKDDLVTAFHSASIGLHLPVDYPMSKIMYSGKVFDYMATGLPVISTVKGLTGELIDRSGGGVITEDFSPTAIASSVLELSILPKSELCAMGQRGQKWILKYFDADSLARKQANFINQTPKKGYTLLLFNLFSSAIFATFDMLTGRSKIAVQFLEHEDQNTYNILNFDKFIEEQEYNDGGSKPLVMPKALTNR
jgi:glycosyltransferase involved in cell wall biosynthesis